MNKLIIILLIFLPLSMYSQGYSYMGKRLTLETNNHFTTGLTFVPYLMGMLQKMYPIEEDLVTLWGIQARMNSNLMAHVIVNRKTTVGLGYARTRSLVSKGSLIMPEIHSNGLALSLRRFNYGELGTLAPFGRYHELLLYLEKHNTTASLTGPFHERTIMLQYRYGYQFSLGDHFVIGMGASISSPPIPLKPGEINFDMPDPFDGIEGFSSQAREYLLGRVAGFYINIGPLT